MALKLIRPAAGSAELMRRFDQERLILGSLAHPHIASLLDGGNVAMSLHNPACAGRDGGEIEEAERLLRDRQALAGLSGHLALP